MTKTMNAMNKRQVYRRSQEWNETFEEARV